MKKLSQADRDFFLKVYNSASLNPFSTERQASDASALGVASGAQPFAHLHGLLGEIKRRTDALAADGVGMDNLPPDEAKLFEMAVLFLTFHQYCRPLDSYIVAQSERNGEPLPAECGAAIFAHLRSLGFTVAFAERCVAVFFQLRRAYLFISSGLVGECESMRRLRVELWNAVFTSDLRLYLDSLWNRMEDFSTLLLGETGTGKGAAAMAIGRSNYIPYISRRRAFAENFNDAFLSINLSEFSESLIESELFGHVKGAFTGAVGDHDGIFSRCSNHGAIFLDEIGDVSERVQIKLLKVLQERSFSPVGGYQKIRFGGRLVAATNQDLARRRAEGTFRNDFYYRLSSSHIVVPPLRQRIAENPDEVRLLLKRIIRRLTGEGNPVLADRVRAAIARDLPQDYGWPGNVRELEQATRSIIVTGSYHGEAGAAPAAAKAADAGLAKVANCELSLDELQRWYCRRLYDRLGSYGDAARRLGIDWRTVKEKVSASTLHPRE